MKQIPTELPGVVVIEPQVFGDNRGFFMESWNSKRYSPLGVAEAFVQDNVSFSARGVLRGLHFQNPKGQGKLVSVLQGEVFDVAVDVRRGSPTFGRWHGAILSAENKHQMYIPPGFAHGFLVTSETALFTYKCSEFYDPTCEISLSWNDPDIGIQWPIAAPVLSKKDQDAPRLKDLAVDRLPIFSR